MGASLAYDGPKTRFDGYDTLAGDAKVVALYRDGAKVDRLAAGERGVVVLDRTPFYAESGGQVGDRGELSRSGSCLTLFAVEDTQKIQPDVFGHLGDGNLHYNLAVPAGRAAAAFLDETARANRIVYDLVARLGGSFSAEHGVGQMKRGELLRYKSPVEVELMQRIKGALDPDALLNPGKVV